jgi:hypothetical protein
MWGTANRIIQVVDEIRLKIDGEESAWRIVGEVRSSVNFGQSPLLYATNEYFTHWAASWAM